MHGTHEDRGQKRRGREKRYERKMLPERKVMREKGYQIERLRERKVRPDTHEDRGETTGRPTG